MQTRTSGNLPTLTAPPHYGSLRDFLSVLFSHWKTFLLFFGGTVLAVTLYSFLTPATYQSDAKLLIRIGRENLSLDPTVEGPTVNLQQTRTNEVNSELAMIRSRYLAQMVVDKLTPAYFQKNANHGFSLKSFIKGLLPREEESPEEIRDDYIDLLTTNLQVGVETDSNVIDMSYQSTSPQQSRKILDTFLAAYQEHHIQVHSSQASPQFFEKQAAKLSKELNAKENALEQFRSKNQIASLDLQKEKLFSQISKLQSDLSDVNSQISATRAQNEALAKALAKLPKTVVLNRVTGRKDMALDTIKTRLFDLRIKEADLSSRYPDNNRELVEVRRQINLAESMLKTEKSSDEIATGIDPNFQSMQLSLENGRAQLTGQLARRQAIQKELADPQSQLAMLVKHEAIETRLKRDITLLTQQYLQEQQDLQRTKDSRALDMDKVSNVRIMQPASLSLDPVLPRKGLNIGLGMFFGLFGAICLAFLLEYLDDSLKTKEEVEKRLGLPVLASVPL